MSDTVVDLPSHLVLVTHALLILPVAALPSAAPASKAAWDIKIVKTLAA